jgi:hypothetical protein
VANSKRGPNLLQAGLGTGTTSRARRSYAFSGDFMSLLQLDPSIPVITPKGDGYAHILIDYGAEFNLLWVVFLDDSGECWTFDNTQIRAQKNVTMGRTHVSMHKAPSIAAE